MFKEMRRHKQQLSKEECLAILAEGKSGVLNLLGEDGYPYGVPLSYVYHDGKVYFHSAKKGHKLEAMAYHDKASFTVIAQDDVVPKELTTYFRSVILFGRIKILSDDEAIKKGMKWLGLKYHDDVDFIEEEINKEWLHLICMVLDVEHMSGKEAIELVNNR